MPDEHISGKYEIANKTNNHDSFDLKPTNLDTYNRNPRIIKPTPQEIQETPEQRLNRLIKAQALKPHTCSDCGHYKNKYCETSKGLYCGDRTTVVEGSDHYDYWIPQTPQPEPPIIATNINEIIL